MHALNLKGASGESIKIEVADVPIISRPITRPPIDKAILESFEGDLTHSLPEGKVAVDILIGQDLYWTVVKEGIRRPSNSSLVAQETVFGWILSGPRQH